MNGANANVSRAGRAIWASKGTENTKNTNHQETQGLINMVEEESTQDIRPSGHNAMAGDVIAPSK